MNTWTPSARAVLQRHLDQHRARFAAEGVLCRGFFMVSCIVPSSPRRVSQETVQRTTGCLEICGSDGTNGRAMPNRRPCGINEFHGARR